MNKTIVNIERISSCFPKLNIAKSGFYNFESDALDHSATLPTADFTTLLCVFVKALLTFVACIHANEFKRQKRRKTDIPKVIDAEFILLRPDRGILRQTSHQGQGKVKMPENRQADSGKTAFGRFSSRGTPQGESNGQHRRRKAEIRRRGGNF